LKKNPYIQTYVDSIFKSFYFLFLRGTGCSEISNKNLKSQEMFQKYTLNAFIVLIEII